MVIWNETMKAYSFQEFAPLCHKKKKKQITLCPGQKHKRKFTLAKENLGFRPAEVYQSFGIKAKAVTKAKSQNV